MDIFNNEHFIAENKSLLREWKAMKKSVSDLSELMVFLRKMLNDKDEVPFQKYIHQLKLNSQIRKHEFLNLDLSALRKNKDTYVLFLYALAQYYHSFCFFPDKEIIGKFRHWGVPLPQLKWMMPLDEVISIIDEMNVKEKLCLLKNQLFFFIDIHLKDKILHEIFEWGRKTAPKKVNLNIEREYILLFRRLKEGNGILKSFKNEGEIFIVEFLNKIQIESPILNPIQPLLLNKFRGKTDELCFKNIFYSRILVDDISENQLLIAFYDLFRTICKDKRLFSKSKFKQEVEKRSIKTEETYYDDDFDFYRSHKLKKLIFKK